MVLGMAGTANVGTIVLNDTTIFTPTTAYGLEDGTVDYISRGVGAVNFLNRTGDYVEWAHNFTFDPAADSILNATLTVLLRDDETDTLNPLSWEFGWGIAEDGSWDFGAVSSGSYTYTVKASYLTDGRFAVKVGSLAGDFYVDRSVLSITYQPVAVPDPGSTFLLFGIALGILGMGAWCRGE